MSKTYARVRRSWEFVEPRDALEAVWQGARFEREDKTREALLAYEVAVRVEGWDAVKSWAQEIIAQGKMLQAHMVELAMRAVERRDRPFFAYLTHALMEASPPKMFRFWVLLFKTRHTHFGEKLFREQLSTLSDYHVVKYRRVLRKILRTLRFRCKTPREIAAGAIIFGEYKKYDPKAYPSELFETYIACHRIARTRPKTKTGKLVTKAQHVERFSEIAGRLGIWSVVEGIRTSYQLPRTLEYLCTMAPEMTDHELLRTLKMFDAHVKTASHKKASEHVLSLAAHLKSRLTKMDVDLERWCTIYPHMHSKVIVDVLESVIAERIDALRNHRNGPAGWCPALLVPSGEEARSLRRILATSAVWMADHAEFGSLSMCDPGGQSVRVGCSAGPLFPLGVHTGDAKHGWTVSTPSKYRALFRLIRGELGDLSLAGLGSPTVHGFVRALRGLLKRRIVLDGKTRAEEIPVVFVADPWTVEEGIQLRAHADHFRNVVCVVTKGTWGKHAKGLGEGHNILFLSLGATVSDTLAAVENALNDVWAQSGEDFEGRKSMVDRAARHLMLSTSSPAVSYLTWEFYDAADVSESET